MIEWFITSPEDLLHEEIDITVWSNPYHKTYTDILEGGIDSNLTGYYTKSELKNRMESLFRYWKQKQPEATVRATFRRSGNLIASLPGFPRDRR